MQVCGVATPARASAASTSSSLCKYARVACSQTENGTQHMEDMSKQAGHVGAVTASFVRQGAWPKSRSAICALLFQRPPPQVANQHEVALGAVPHISGPAHIPPPPPGGMCATRWQLLRILITPAQHMIHPALAGLLRAHLAGAGKQFADALKDRVGEGVGGKGDDKPVLRQAGQVRHHAVHLVLQNKRRRA